MLNVSNSLRLCVRCWKVHHKGGTIASISSSSSDERHNHLGSRFLKKTERFPRSNVDETDEGISSRQRRRSGNEFGRLSQAENVAAVEQRYRKHENFRKSGNARRAQSNVLFEMLWKNGRQSKYGVSKHTKFERRDSSWYIAKCQKLLDSGKVAHALFLFQNMLQQNQQQPPKVEPDAEIFMVILQALSSGGFVRKCFEIAEQMLKCGLPHSISVYSMLFNACNVPDVYRDYALECARCLRQQMQDDRVQPNRTLYFEMVRAFARCGDIKAAFDIALKVMPADGFPVDADTLRVLLSVCANDARSGFARALVVFAAATRGKFAIDLNMLTGLLLACRDGGFEADNELKSSFSHYLNGESRVHFALDGSASNQLVNLNVPGNQLIDYSAKRGFDLLGGLSGLQHLMDEHCIKPNAKLFSICVPIVNAVDPDPAKFSLVDLAHSFGVNLDINFYNRLMLRYGHDGMEDSAWKTLTLILKAESLHPDLGTLLSLAHSCRSTEEMHRAFETFEMFGIFPNLHAFYNLLDSALRRIDFDYAQTVLKEMTRQRIVLNKKFVTSVLDALDKLTESKSTSAKSVQSFHSFFCKWLKRMHTREKDPWRTLQQRVTEESVCEMLDDLKA